MKELKQRITESGIDYVLIEDYYYPSLELLKDEEPHYVKYGSMRLNYIKEHKKGSNTLFYVLTIEDFNLQAFFHRLQISKLSSLSIHIHKFNHAFSRVCRFYEDKI